MGPDERTTSDIEADAFFQQFEHMSVDLFERVWAERYGDIEAVLAEQKAFGYWARVMAARDERRALRELAATRARTAQNDRLERLRVPDASAVAVASSAVILPAPRIVLLSDAERVETERWWQRLIERRGTRTIVWRMRTENRQPEADDRFQSRATKAWQAEQRAFERAQWLAVTPGGRARRAVANRWVAISEDRALAIALAALATENPPQGHK